MPTTDFHFCDLGIRLLGYFKVKSKCEIRTSVVKSKGHLVQLCAYLAPSGRYTGYYFHIRHWVIQGQRS